MRLLLPPLALSASESLRTTCSYYLASPSRWPWVILAACLALRSYLILDYTSSQAVEMRRDSLASMCDERARMIQDQYNVSMNHLQGLAILVSGFHHSKDPFSTINYMAFARYAEIMASFERPLMSGVVYGVRIPHAERQQFERQQRWSIKNMYSSKNKKQSPSPSPGNAHDAAEVRETAEEYAPVIFAQETYMHVISSDLLSGVDNHDNVLRARESEKGVLTAPFKLLNNHLGVILTYAVYKYELPRNGNRPQERIQAAIGYLGGIVDFEALVDKLLHQLAGKQSIMVNVYDTTHESSISMYGSNDTESGMCRVSPLCHVSALDFGDPSRKHEMHCRFIQSPPWPWVAITSSIGTLVIALLIAKRIARVEDEIIVLTTHPEDAIPSLFFYLRRNVVNVSLLGLMLCILIICAFDISFNQNLSGGRLLIDTLHDGARAEGGVENSDMISVDLRKMRGNCDSSGQNQHIWFSRIPSNYQEEATEKQSGTVKSHQPAHVSHKKTMVGLWIALASTIVLVLGIAVWLLLCCNRLKSVQQNELELLGGIMGPRRLQLCELVAATNNFADENKLGQGGFGPVYKGYLQNQDSHVAIKVLYSQQQSEQGLREFMAEVKVMTQLRHRNIVNLVGWCQCDSQQRLLLVYELMAQGSLDKHLYDPEEILTWQQRYKIVLDLGNALLYLHLDCDKCIVHGDIKPANVMLDASYNAKLGDFGLARFIEHGQEPRTTQVIAGTAGYIDPEFIANRWPRTELDVYSFGVVLLEIACGKRPTLRQPNGASSLLTWVIRLYDQGMILDAADQRLNGEFDRQQMERVLVTGLWCAHRDPIQRPSIEQAMDVLRSADAELPVLRSVHDERHIRAMEEQAYGDLQVEDHPVHPVTTSTYFTSKDSAYLLAQQ